MGLDRRIDDAASIMEIDRIAEPRIVGSETFFENYFSALKNEMTDYDTARRVLDGPVSWDLVDGLGRELHKGLIDAWHWGAESVIKYLTRKVANQVQYVFDLKFAEAEKALRLQAFTIAGIKNAETLDNMRNILIDCLDEGLTFQTFQDRAGQVIDKPRWHLELIYRNNLMTAFHTGRYAQLMDEDVRMEFPLWEYNAILDGAVRPSHAAMDGKRFLSNDPIWDKWYPPNGHNCRCGISAVSRYEMEEENIQPTGPPPMSVEPDIGWERNAGKSLVWLDKWQEGKMRGVEAGKVQTEAKAEAKGGFVPAKTVKEAEEWARKNNIDIAYKENDIIKVMTRESDRYTERDISELQEMFKSGKYSEANDEMKLKIFNSAFDFYQKNPTLEKLPIVVYKDNSLFSFGEGSLARYDNLHKYIEFNNSKQLDELLSSKTLKIDEKNIGFTSDKFQDKIFGALSHEYGHHATLTLKSGGLLNDKVMTSIQKYVADNWEIISKEISMYAAENNREFLAELYALSKHPDFDKFSDYVKQNVRKYIK